MMDFRELVLHESAHSGLVFRESGYGKGRNNELIRDLISLANAAVEGPRFIVLGVDIRDGGRRRIRGVSREALEQLQQLLPRIATRVIEPPLRLTLRQTVIRDRIVGVIVVEYCDDKPYLLGRDLSRSLHAGRGWVRRGTEIHPLMRADLQKMFTERLPARAAVAPQAAPEPAPVAMPALTLEPEPAHERPPASLVIGFPGKPPVPEISLPALPLDELPSQLAAARLQKMLEGRASARDVLGRTETQFSRLLHAQLFGADKSFEKQSDATLMQQILQVGEANEAEDRYYEFELRAHKLQLEIRNNFAYDIEPLTVVLTITATEGMGVCTRVYPSPDAKPGTRSGSGYPPVEEAGKRFVVEATTSRLRAASSRRLFTEPLRLWLREPAVGKTLLIDYRVQGRDLEEPLTGALRIHVEPVRRPAAEGARRSTGTG